MKQSDITPFEVKDMLSWVATKLQGVEREYGTDLLPEEKEIVNELSLCTPYEWNIVGHGCSRIVVQPEDIPCVIKLPRGAAHGVSNGLVQNTTELFLWDYFYSICEINHYFSKPLDFDVSGQWIMYEKGEQLTEETQKFRQIKKRICLMFPWIEPHELTPQQFIRTPSGVKLCDYGIAQASVEL